MTDSTFLLASAYLTGFPQLPADVSEQYYQRLMAAPGYQDVLPEFLVACRSWLQRADPDFLIEQVTASPQYQQLVKGLVFLWYTAELPAYADLNQTKLPKTLQSATEAEQYYSGLLWPCIGAHPPGLTGGYYGHWKYAPEN